MKPLKPLKSIDEQVVVLAGASSGIGRQTALRLAEGGARVVVAARGADGLASLEDEIRRLGSEALSVPTDVADESQVYELARRAVERFGRIDTWVNVAGVSSYGAFEQTPPAEFRRVMEINFFGHVHGARAALPHLRHEGRGALIFIGSVLSDVSVPMQGAYCASKHAVKALSESLRVELEQENSGVQVTLIKPSSINTPFFDNAATHMGVKPRPAPPVYDPDLVAQTIVYAAEHRTRDLVVGGGGKMLTALEAFAGPLMDRALVLAGAKLQRSDDPKPASAPNNLFAPSPNGGRVRGSFSGRSVSLYTSARLHPRLAMAGATALLGVWGVRRTRS